MPKTRLLATVRLFFGVLTLAAVVTQIMRLQDLGVYNPVNFFGYFTNLSNILAAMVFLAGAYMFAAGHKMSAKYDAVRGASATGMVIVGVVYGILLSGEDLGGLLPWVNVVLHYIMPVAVLADWLLFPPKTKLRAERLTDWLLFPVAYVTYTLVRGAHVGWYPYPFLNPSEVNGYLAVSMYCVVIAATFAACGWLLIMYTRTPIATGLGTGHGHAPSQTKLKKARKRS